MILKVIPGVKHGPVLKVPVVMHQQDVSVLGLSVTEKRSVQDFYLHLSFGHFPPADGHQQRGAHAAQHGQQHRAERQKTAGSTRTEKASASSGEAAATAAAAAVGPLRGSDVSSCSLLQEVRFSGWFPLFPFKKKPRSQIHFERPNLY